jgi:MOSC domain-containing protein YiiM
VKVVAIHIAPGSRLPTRSVDSVDAEARKGLIGDRYHGSRRRQVTLQSQEALDRAAADLGHDFDCGATRRNITVDSGEIPTTPGTRLRIGMAEFDVVRDAAPCRLLDDWIGPGAMAALRGRAGSALRVLRSGTIRVGDAVEIDPPDIARRQGVALN